MRVWLEEVDMRLKRLAAPSLAIAVIALTAGTTFAQGPGSMRGERGWGMGDGMGMGWGMWRGGPWGRGPDWMLDRVEGRLAFVKAELKVTETQTPAWNQLADAIRTAAKHHNERMKSVISGEQQAKTLLDRLEVQEQFMSARLEEIKQIKGGLKGLYAVLSEDQKKEADYIVLPMVGMGGWMMGGAQ
jgi:hypothetical protein